MQEKIVNSIKDFATQAHGEQMRKYTPEKYIEHPIRVMELCRKYDERPEILAAALLHDLVEDTSVRHVDIVIFLKTLLPVEVAERIGKIVEELTDVYVKESFPLLNRKQRKRLESKRLQHTSSEAQTVKYADMIDNSQDIVLYAAQFSKKYLKELQEILKLTHKGNPALYKLATDVISNALKQVFKS